MRFIDVIKICLSKYFDISGRANRREYWSFQIFLFIIALVCVALEIGIYYVTDIYDYDIIRLYLIFDSFLFFIFLMFNTSVTVRRLHDTNRNFAYLLLYLIPLWGLVINTIYLTQPGDEHCNHYGEPPELYGYVVDSKNVVLDTDHSIEEVSTASNNEISNEIVNIDSNKEDKEIISTISYYPPWKD